MELFSPSEHKATSRKKTIKRSPIAAVVIELLKPGRFLESAHPTVSAKAYKLYGKRRTPLRYVSASIFKQLYESGVLIEALGLYFISRKGIQALRKNTSIKRAYLSHLAAQRKRRSLTPCTVEAFAPAPNKSIN